MSRPLAAQTFHQVHTTAATRAEGGNATHLSKEPGGAPICGAPMKFWSNAGDMRVDPNAPWSATDCGNCQRIAGKPVDSSSKAT